MKINKTGIKLILILCIVETTTVSSQTPDTIDQPSWVKIIPSAELVQWRRHIHQNPELSFKETGTSAYVEGILRSFGNIEIVRPGPTSVVGILKGPKPGRIVAFRSDMDALPVQEETGLPFASIVPGVSHACGHDFHTAILLGTAETLSKMQKQLTGTILFIFQHAEEMNPGGAAEIIKSGVLKGVEAVFGMHVIPNYPAGHIGILPEGAATTASDIFYVTIQGKGTHGSMPHLGIDPVLTGAEIVTTLQTVVSRNVVPGEMAVLSIGKFQSGEAPNVIPDKAYLAGTVRTVSDSTRQLIAQRVKTVIENIVKANGADYKLDYIFSYPAIMNDPAMRIFAMSSAKKILGISQVFEAPRLTVSEDFSRYRELAPIFYMILGAGPGPANHNPAFSPDEDALMNGVKVQIQIILDFLKIPR
jgi:amidohydrolase